MKRALAVFLGVALVGFLIGRAPAAVQPEDLSEVIDEIEDILTDGLNGKVGKQVILDRLSEALVKLKKVERGEPLVGGKEITEAYRDTWGAIFSDDFTGKRGGVWEIADGNWEVNEGEGFFEVSSGKTDHPTVFAGDASWDNYTLYARVMLAETTSQAGAIFRAFDQNNYYELVLNSETNAVELWSYTGGNRVSIREAKVDVWKNRWYNLRIKAVGNHIVIFVNNIKKIDIRSGKFVAGKIGLSVYGKNKARFDDLIVKPVGK